MCGRLKVYRQESNPQRDKNEYLVQIDFFNLDQDFSGKSDLSLCNTISGAQGGLIILKFHSGYKSFLPKKMGSRDC